MRIDRRAFLGSSAAAAIGTAACTQPPASPAPAAPAATGGVPASIQALKPMTAGVVPISADERGARLEKARKLMVDNKIGAIYLEGGSSMYYFTGVRWGLSERPFVCVIPAKGELGWVVPGFEEARARELVTGKADVRVWQEDESPYKQIAGILKDRGVSSRQGGRGGAPALLHLQRREEGAAGRGLQRRRGDHGRLPHVQVAGGDRAHAARERHHDRGLPRGVRHAAKRA